MGIEESPLSGRDTDRTRVAVIVLTLNQSAATLRCLESFSAVEGPSFRIVVWDNGSTDGTDEAVRRHFPEVLVHRHPGNLGVASGRNAAAALATERLSPEFLFFLDNDTRVAPDVLAALVSPFADEDRLAATAPKLRLLRDPQRIDMAGGARIRYWLASTKGIGHGEIDRGQYDTPTECVTGGCVLVRTGIFHELGGFDPAFDPYGPEDLDFSLRAIQAGYRCLYVPRALIWHDPTQTFEGGRYTENLVRHKTRQWHLFLHRHAPPWKRAAFYGVGVPLLLMRMVLREGRRGNLGAVRGVLRAAQELSAPMRSPIGPRVRRSIEKNTDEARAFVADQMPAFVVRRRPPWPVEPPVFVFHDVDPASFSKQLELLTRNGFRTLDADGIADAYEKGVAPEGDVGLTFDDATWTFWAYAFPLLRRFGFQAVLFVVPGVVPERTEPRPSLQDVWEGSCTPEEVLEAGREPAFCTWSEIERMHESGIVDVQSHSLSHARIPVSPRVVDFHHPGYEPWAGGFDIPVSTLDHGGDGARVVRPGAPIFQSASRLSGRRRFLEEPDLVEALIAIATRREGDFFERPGWRGELRRTLGRRPHAARGRFESAAEREAALRHELVESRRRIEARLPGHAVRHLAYPWHQGSALPDRVAAESGYRAVHYGAFLDERESRPPSPIRVRRLPERYLGRLPGRERVSLWAALSRGRRSPRGGS